jgi:predicted secreted protein
MGILLCIKFKNFFSLIYFPEDGSITIPRNVKNVPNDTVTNPRELNLQQLRCNEIEYLK